MRDASVVSTYWISVQHTELLPPMPEISYCDCELFFPHLAQCQPNSWAWVPYSWWHDELLCLNRALDRWDTSPNLWKGSKVVTLAVAALMPHRICEPVLAKAANRKFATPELAWCAKNEKPANLLNRACNIALASPPPKAGLPGPRKIAVQGKIVPPEAFRMRKTN